MTRVITLVSILRAQGIEVGRLGSDYRTGTDTLPAGSYLVKLDQPYGRLARNLLDKDVLHIGSPSGTVQAAIDMMVHKFGRTTSYTSGRITSTDTDVVVEYETGEFTFESQIIIRGSDSTMFSDSGDSGSIILQRGTNAAVGLLFGGSSSYTIANHIANVLRSLRVRMA